MAWDHALKMQSSHNIYLFIADFSVKYDIFIVEQEAIKACAGRGVLLSRRHNIAVVIFNIYMLSQLFVIF